MDVRRVRPPGRPLIEQYGPGGFRIGGTLFSDAVLVLPNGAIPWHPADATVLAPTDLTAIAEHGDVKILLIGTGMTIRPVSSTVRAALRDAGIGVDVMDTNAACRTYGVLAGEDRQVAAALLPFRPD